MRHIPLLLSLGAATVAAQTLLKCNADNCLRAIRASAFPGRSGSADCISFLQNYVTSTVTTTEITTISDTTSVTTTVTIPVEAPPPDCKCKRQAPAPEIPAYASNCGGFSRYYSACACVGATTTAAPTTTTVTKTSTTVISASSTATAVSFFLQLQNGSGFYIGRNPTSGWAIAVSSISQAVQLYRQPNGHIEIAGGVSAKLLNAASDAGGILLSDGDSDGTSPLTCLIDGNQYFTCEHGGEPGVLGLQFKPDGSALILGKSAQAVGGQVVVVKAVPASL
ncbi:hypothetical protein TWF481_001181 [Arthrobotrys musiformis]|uniref:Uncharacterized protein n=1 Tax=Arthrobotrys musiformis TaxID=47236 RepID=A0AAV9WQ27_9PEZI